MALNLSRASRFFISPHKKEGDAALTIKSFYEVNVLDGYSFSQTTETQEVTLSETGKKPVRGQKVFNTSINPGELSFTTYIKGYKESANSSNAIELFLWNALLTSQDNATPSDLGSFSGTTKQSIYQGAGLTTRISSILSDTNQVMLLDVYILLDNTMYKLSKACINTAEIDFAIDDIAKIAWTGYCDNISEVEEINMDNSGDSTVWPANPEDKLYIDLTPTNGTKDTDPNNASNNIVGYTSTYLAISPASQGSFTYKNVTVPGVSRVSSSGNTEPTMLVNKLSAIDLVRQTSIPTRKSTVVLTGYTGNINSAIVSANATTAMNIPIRVLSTTEDNTDQNPVIKLLYGVTGTRQDLLDAMNYSMAMQGFTAYFTIEETAEETLLQLINYGSDMTSTSKIYTIENMDSNATNADNATSMYLAFGATVGTITAATAHAPATDRQIYTLAITGGSLTISNNITYLTPEELGVLNLPVNHFTGTKSITGNVTAYLKTGTSDTGAIYKELVARKSTSVEKFYITLYIGGRSPTPVRHVKVHLPNCHISVPTVNVEDVISTEISLFGLSTELEHKNEFFIEYIYN